jgi:hypothetical protein
MNMKLEYVSYDTFKALVAAANKGSWTERAITILDKDFMKSNCIHHDGGYVVVDDAYDITVLHIDEHGFVSEVMEEDR